MRHTYNEDKDFTVDMPFGEFLRKKRRLMGYNQTDFSEIIGVDRSTLSRWELREDSPSFEKAKEIIRRLGGDVLIENHMIGIPECPLGYNPYQE